LPISHELVERAERLLDRRLRVLVVREVHVHTLDAQPAQAALELPADPGRPEAPVLALVHRVEDLRRELDALSDLRASRAKPVADVALAAPAAVCVRRVEGRNAELPRGVHQRERLLPRLALAEERRRRANPAEVPAAEDQPRDLEAAPAEWSPLHRPILGRLSRCVPAAGPRCQTPSQKSRAGRSAW